MQQFHINTNNATTNIITVPLPFSIFKKYSHYILYSLPYNQHLVNSLNISVFNDHYESYVDIFPVGLTTWYSFYSRFFRRSSQWQYFLNFCLLTVDLQSLYMKRVWLHFHSLSILNTLLHFFCRKYVSQKEWWQSDSLSLRS